MIEQKMNQASTDTGVIGALVARQTLPQGEVQKNSDAQNPFQSLLSEAISTELDGGATVSGALHLDDVSLDLPSDIASQLMSSESNLSEVLAQMNALENSEMDVGEATIDTAIFSSSFGAPMPESVLSIDTNEVKSEHPVMSDTQINAVKVDTAAVLNKTSVEISMEANIDQPIQTDRTPIDNNPVDNNITDIPPQILVSETSVEDSETVDLLDVFSDEAMQLPHSEQGLDASVIKNVSQATTDTNVLDQTVQASEQAIEQPLQGSENALNEDAVTLNSLNVKVAETTSNAQGQASVNTTNQITQPNNNLGQSGFSQSFNQNGSGQQQSSGQQQNGAADQGFQQLQKTVVNQHKEQELQLREKAFSDILKSERTLSTQQTEAAKVTTELNASEKRAQLPSALQSITQPVRHPQWGQALGQRVVVMANNNIQEAKIMLNPEKLGPVQIKLQMDKEQQLHVSMTAQHNVTREAMENTLPRLKEMLESAGIQNANINVKDERQFDQQDQQQNRENSKGSNGLAGDEQVDEIQTESKQVTSDSLVDYYA